MAETTVPRPESVSPNGSASHAGSRAAVVAESERQDPARQAFWMLRVGFTVLPLVMGLDKFFNVLTEWPHYLASWYNAILPGSAQTGMYIIGVVEIAAAVLVALKPRYAAYIVAAWLAGIILDLVTLSGFYDVALRDFGLLVAALALARLASKYDPPFKGWKF